MKSIEDELRVLYKSVNLIVNKNMKWKKVSITPKIIQTKALSKFTKEEKEALTKKGIRWKVYYYYFNSDTGAFDKYFVSLPINSDFKDFDTRYRVINEIAQATKELLTSGFIPPKRLNKDETTINDVFHKSLDIKKNEVGNETFRDYRIRTINFIDYLRKTNKHLLPASQLDAKMVRDFLNLKLQTTSATNRNNYLRSLRSVIKCMYENEMIDTFFIDKIKPIKSEPKTQKIFTEKETDMIFQHLESTDNVMLLFIYFVSYNFLRPKEIVRLTMGDINVDEKYLSVRIKQKISKTKRVPDIIINIIKDLDYSEPSKLLFTNKGLVNEWDLTERRRRQHFSKRFLNVRKTLGFGNGYGLYSFRHTYVTRAYKSLRKRLSKDDALDELMRYTGHETRLALSKYIHNIDADIVDDYDSEVK